MTSSRWLFAYLAWQLGTTNVHSAPLFPPASTTEKQLTRAKVDGSFRQLDKIVAATLKKTGVPGASVAVVYNDRVIYAKGYGLRQLGKPDRVDADTVFQIASLSKPVSSTVVAGIVGAGKVAWDDPVIQWDPSFALSDPAVTQQLTIADLYSHRSGLPAGAGDDLEAMGYDQAEVLRRLRYQPLGPFRAVYHYANFGLTEGGVAAAKGDGVPFAEAAERRLFSPAGMKSSSFRYADYLARPNRASIHAKINGKFLPLFQRKPDAQAPAGGASSNAKDMGTWLRIQLAHGKLGDRQIIAAEPLDATHAPMIHNRPDQPTNFYGLGWNISSDPRGESLWSHSGAFSQGTGTTVRAFPNEGFAVVVLSNGSPVGAAEAIADSYIDVVFSGKPQQDWLKTWGQRFAPILAPSAPKAPAHPTPPRAYTSYTGSYANDYYGAFTISERAGKLVMAVGPSAQVTYTLEPFDGDSFLFSGAPELPAQKTLLTFQPGVDGTATRLILDPALASSVGTLVRQP